MPPVEASATHSIRMLPHARPTFSLWEHTDTPAFEILSSAGQQKACSRGRRFRSFCRIDCEHERLSQGCAMIRLQTDIQVPGLNSREVTDFMLNCDDASYQAWWPGVHLRFHTVRKVAGDVGNLIYMDEYVGRFRLKIHAVVTASIPGKEITWQFVRRVRLPGRLILGLEDEADGVAISHVVEAGFRGPGRIFDAVLRFWFTPEFADALDEHVRTEFPEATGLAAFAGLWGRQGVAQRRSAAFCVRASAGPWMVFALLFYRPRDRKDFRNRHSDSRKKARPIANKFSN